MLVLENHDKKVVRVFPWSGEGRVYAIFRKDKKRLDLVDSDTKDLFLKKGVPLALLGEVSLDSLQGKPFEIPLSGIPLGSLRWVPEVQTQQGRHLDPHHEQQQLLNYEKDLEPASKIPLKLSSVSELCKSIFIDCTTAHKQVTLRAVSALCMVITLIFVLAIVLQEKELSGKIVEELKQEVVKMRKKRKIQKPKTVSVVARIVSPHQKRETLEKQPEKKKKKVVKKSLRRMGALAVLGKLSAQKGRKGGLDLKKAKTSLGPGLGGGTRGSGGVQTSLYGKGIVSAPLGAGNNIHGGGGYGTKGKGGGKAGYGRRTLIGSVGDATLGLGRESLGENGLDKDAIAKVIREHEGEVRFCYEQGLLMDPKISGRVAVAFVIGARGSVRKAEVAHTTLQFKSVEDCILQKLKAWKFPLPRGGVNVAISYPFLLKRLGQR